MKLSKEQIFDASVKLAVAYVGTISSQDDFQRVKQNATANNFDGVSDYIAQQCVHQALQIEEAVDRSIER